MAMHNPKGRANYEPNGWDKDIAGPRESPTKGFTSFRGQVEGEKTRLRAESFGDHFSQARQFYISQTDVEKTHIANALTFELSKCEFPQIRKRVVSQLMNIDEELANKVAQSLGIDEKLQAAETKIKANTTLKASDALSILKNTPNSFKGRKLGIFISDGIKQDDLKILETEFTKAGATVERIALKVGGVKDAEGKRIEAQYQIDGGQSVLFDAVAILVSEDETETLGKSAALRDFLNDAYAHYKFIGYHADAMGLFQSIGLDSKMDDGFVKLDDKNASQAFLKQCCALRFWDRPDGA